MKKVKHITYFPAPKNDNFLYCLISTKKQINEAVKFHNINAKFRKGVGALCIFQVLSNDQYMCILHMPPIEDFEDNMQRAISLLIHEITHLKQSIMEVDNTLNESKLMKELMHNLLPQYIKM